MTVRYTYDHEWVSVNGNIATIGITDYAQAQLGDVVFVDLPSVGEELTQFGKMGEIESVKAVSDLYCPLAGRVVEVNTTLADRPELVNADPHGAWMIALELTNAADTSGLLGRGEG